jgi:predicted HTH domain antitoxin
MRTVEVPDEILDLLATSRLGQQVSLDGVRVALAIHLFLEDVVSIGKASDLAGIPRLDFEELMHELGLPVARYSLDDYQQDLHGLAEARRRSQDK